MKDKIFILTWKPGYGDSEVRAFVDRDRALVESQRIQKDFYSQVGRPWLRPGMVAQGIIHHIMLPGDDTISIREVEVNDER